MEKQGVERNLRLSVILIGIFLFAVGTYMLVVWNLYNASFVCELCVPSLLLTLESFIGLFGIILMVASMAIIIVPVTFTRAYSRKENHLRAKS